MQYFFITTTIKLESVHLLHQRFKVFSNHLASFRNLWKSMFLPVVVEYLREYARMTVEEILVEDGVVIGQGFGQPRQPQVRSLILNFALPAFYNQGPLKHFSVVFRESVRRNASDCFSLTFFCFLFVKNG